MSGVPPPVKMETSASTAPSSVTVEGATRVRAQDPEHPEYGSIEMVFSANPLALRQWVITDDAGGQTTVILGEMATGRGYKDSLFSISTEAEKRDQR